MRDLESASIGPTTMGFPGPSPAADNVHRDSLSQHIAFLHERLAQTAPAVSRIAMALYDSEQGCLKTFVNSTHEGYAISGYQFPLAESVSLSSLAMSRQTRVIEDIPATLDAEREHSRYVRDEGYLSSFTVPMHHSGAFLGFVFFDSREHGTFTPELQRELVLYAQLLTVSLEGHLAAVRSLVGTVQVARELTELRDFETGAHIERMSRMSRATARQLADSHGLDDEFIEALYLYAPLHDIGKIGVRDQVLLKPGPLDDSEWEEMKEHTTKGRVIVDAIIADLGLDGITHADVLRHVVELHHERLDGSGYPHGLKGDEVPIESRIVAVCDVFDALTSDRPYKPSWTPDQAFRELDHMAREGSLDAACVAALKLVA